jgi:hypothetical protein
MVRFTKLGVRRNQMAVVSSQCSSRTAPVANLNGAAGDKKKNGCDVVKLTMRRSQADSG